MRYYLFFFLSVNILLMPIISAQDLEFISTIDVSQQGGPEHDFDFFSSSCSDDTFIYTAGVSEGYFAATTSRVNKLWMTKWTKDGNLVQSLTYDNIIDDVKKVFIDNDDNLIVFGGNQDSYVAKLDKSLNLILFKYTDYAFDDLVQHGDGNYYGTFGSGTFFTNNDSKLAYYDSEFQNESYIQLEILNFTGQFLEFHRIVKNGDNFVVTGIYSCCPLEDYPNLGSGKKREIVVAEITPEAELLWIKTYGGTQDENIVFDRDLSIRSQLVAMPNGDFVFTFSTRSDDGDVSNPYGTINNQRWMFRISSTGDLLWKSNTILNTTDLKIINESELALVVRGIKSSSISPNWIECDTCSSYVAWLGIFDSTNGVFKRQSYVDSEREEAFTALEVGNDKLLLFGYTESGDDQGIFYDEDTDGHDAIVFSYGINTNDEGLDLDNDGYNSSVDCDDNNPEVNPGAIEICDDIDNNCNGETDEGLDFLVYYLDNDNDGYGDSSISEESCMNLSGWVTTDGDCNDTNPEANPGAIDIPDNGIDEDCDGVDAESVIMDNDNDGYDETVDCDDTNPLINPGAEEICDEIDNNCDGEVDEGLSFLIYYIDSDGDGFGDNNSAQENCMNLMGLTTLGGDCDDNNPTINPDAIDIPDNGIDEDCDGLDASDEPCSHPDYDGLIALYQDAGGSNWSKNDGWKEGASGESCEVCEWYGVGCTNGRVTSLLLENNNLNGQLSNSIANLELLNLLNLSSNELSGQLPEQLFDLIQLNFLLLHSNNFVGELSGTISNLSDLKFLTIQNNEFSGSLPTTIGTLTNLEEVYLHNNFFTGTIPTNLSSLSNLKVFYASLNKLEGTIPSSLGSLNLEQLHLEFNNLSGCIPASFMNLCGKEISIDNDLLPWSGDMDRFCDGDDQIGATCLSNNQFGIIDEDCNCKIATTVEGIELNDIKIFPNPTTNHVVLESTVRVDYKLVTTLGEIVKSGTCDGTSTISIGEQSRGLYYLVVDNERTYKVIKL